MYWFFIASLPDLQLESQMPPMSVEEFDDLCCGELDKNSFAALTGFDGVVAPDFTGDSRLTGIYNAYGKFEVYLRNRIARRRAEKANEQLELPDPPEYFGEYDFAATTLANTADPAERELIIDRLRWNFIEEQLLCKEFSFDALCAYKLKLAFVNKYCNRKLEPGQKNFDSALERLTQNKVRQE